MFPALLLLFTLLPLVELALLVWIGSKMGLLPTVLLVLTTGVVGASLARAQGLGAWRRFQAAIAAGRLPGEELLEGLLILVAGSVLLTPGVLTDAAGFLLLLPPVRRGLGRWLKARLGRRLVPRAGQRGGDARSGEVLDAEYQVLQSDRDI